MLHSTRTICQHGAAYRVCDTRGGEWTVSEEPTVLFSVWAVESAILMCSEWGCTWLLWRLLTRNLRKWPRNREIIEIVDWISYVRTTVHTRINWKCLCCGAYAGKPPCLIWRQQRGYCRFPLFLSWCLVEGKVRIPVTFTAFTRTTLLQSRLQVHFVRLFF